MIIHNRIRCNKCEKVIESHHRHDFVWCDCVDDHDDGRHNGCAVDGGKDYLRRVGGDYEELSVYSEEDEDKVELVETDGEKSMETLTPLIMDLDEEPEPEKTEEEKRAMLSAKDRIILEQKGLIQTLKETVKLHEEQETLVLALRKKMATAYKQLKTTFLIYDGDVVKPSTKGIESKEMVGDWIAIPEPDYNMLRIILSALKEDEE